MRLLLYLLLLLSGSFVLAAIAQYILFFVKFPLAISVGRCLPYVLLGVRAFIWFKRRSVQAPESFKGAPYALAAACAAVLALAIVAYAALLLLTKGQGLSGVPLGLLLVLGAPVTAIALLIVEYRDYRAFFTREQSVA